MLTHQPSRKLNTNHYFFFYYFVHWSNWIPVQTHTNVSPTVLDVLQVNIAMPDSIDELGGFTMP